MSPMPSTSRIRNPIAFRRSIALTLLCALFLPTYVRADNARTKPHHAVLGLAIGIRTFDDNSGLGDDFSFGGRGGLNLGPRVGIIADFVASHPSRDAATPAVHVDALRMLIRYNIVTGTLRPYVLGGAGGVFFLFHDAPTRSMPAWTGGLGIDYQIAPQTRAFFELSGDLYSEQDVSYDLEGMPVFTGEEQTRSLGTWSVGISVEL